MFGFILDLRLYKNSQDFRISRGRWWPVLRNWINVFIIVYFYELYLSFFKKLHGCKKNKNKAGLFRWNFVGSEEQNLFTFAYLLMIEFCRTSLSKRSVHLGTDHSNGQWDFLQGSNNPFFFVKLSENVIEFEFSSASFFFIFWWNWRFLNKLYFIYIE